MQIDLNTYCELFYSSHYVPIALYEGTKQVAFYSSWEKSLEMNACIMPHLADSSKNPDVFTLPEQGQYAILRIKGSDQTMLIGPVFASRVTENTVLAVARNNFIPTNDLEALGNFLTSIPNYSYNRFVNLIAYLHYSLNNEYFDIQEYFHMEDCPFQSELASSSAENSFQAKEDQQFHGTYQFESMLLSYVQEGDVEKLKSFLLQSARISEFREGTLADLPLRQAKNVFLGLTAYVGKFGAIQGGVDVEEAYRLIDLYSQECENMLSVDAVKQLQYHMLLDFTEHVAECKMPGGISSDIFSCIQYIQNHTCDSIGIDEVAQHIGKSRAWLTRCFREECGVTINEFILQSKIKDAKRLLQYTDKSLAEISYYLCFSSQAYFQTVFKRKVGVTPKEYRQEHSIGLHHD